LQKNGASALGLQQVLGLKRHETAWTLLHKLRRAMVRSGRDLRTGRVEMAEFYVGGLEEGLPGWLNLGKALIVVAAQEGVLGIGRIRMRQFLALRPQARALCAGLGRTGSVIHAEGWLGYLPLESNVYKHEVTFLTRKEKASLELMPRFYHVMSRTRIYPDSSRGAYD